MKRIQGFTLIELLVVIAIIGVLSTLGGAGASMVQKQAKKTQTATIMQIMARTFAPVVKMSFSCLDMNEDIHSLNRW